MKPHPSGRPIHRPERRDYSMMARRREGFICPRLNQPEVPRYDTHAVGFIDLPTRDVLWHYTEAKRWKT